MSLTAPSFWQFFKSTVLWHCAHPASTTRAEYRKLPKSMMIGKALLSGLWAHPQGSFTVRFTFALLTLARVSLSVSPFFCFTTLVATRRCRCLLRSDYEWAVMPDGLRHVISGILAGGDPWFPHVAFVASLTTWYGLATLLVVSFVSAAIPFQDDTMLSLLH